METNKGTIVKWREEVMSEYADAWLEEYEETIEELGLDEGKIVCFFFDDSDDYEFAVPMTDGNYWTAYGIGQRDGQKLFVSAE